MLNRKTALKECANKIRTLYSGKIPKEYHNANKVEQERLQEKLGELEESVMALRYLVADADITISYLMLQKRTADIGDGAKEEYEMIDGVTDELLYRSARIVDFVFSDLAMRSV